MMKSKEEQALIFEKVAANPEYGKLHEQKLGIPQDEFISYEIYGKERRFQSAYDITNSFKKTFHYLGDIAKSSFSIEVGGKLHTYDPPSDVIVSDNLFRGYSCLNYGCSKCCTKTRFWNIFSAGQYEENKRIYENEIYAGKSIIVKVNDKDKEFYVEDHTNTFCDHVDKEGEACRIHLTNPIHCALPLTKFKRVRNKTYVTKEYFGRNWNMKCPAVFAPMTEEGYEGLLYMMDRVKRFADEMEIDTRIDDIIFEIKNKWKEMNYTNILPF